MTKYSLYLISLILGFFSMTTPTYSATLSVSEKDKFANVCKKASNDYIFFEDFEPNREDFKINDEYSYYRNLTKIVKTDSNGATIEAAINTKFFWSEGGNGGWGTKEYKEGSLKVVCVFLEVKRGDYPLPGFFARIVVGTDYDIWVRNAGWNCGSEWEETGRYIVFGRSSITPQGLLWEAKNAFDLELAYLPAARDRFPSTSWRINKIGC